MMFTNIVNKFLNVRNHKQNAAGVWVPDKEPTQKMLSSGSVDMVQGEDIVLFEESKKRVVLDVFEFTINGSDNNTHPTLHIDGISPINNYDGQIFHLLNSTGGGFRFVSTPSRIVGDGSPHFEVMEYNSTLHEYKFSLTRPIELPQGGRLGFRPISSYTGGDKVQYKVVYRVWE